MNDYRKGFRDGLKGGVVEGLFFAALAACVIWAVVR